MSKYTEQQLNALNKTALVGLALELGIQVASFQAGPLKGSDVEKTMLDLARQAANIKSNDTARAQAHELALAKIDSDKELAIKKLELEFADSTGLDAAALNAAYKSIEEKSKLAIEDLSFGLQKAELANKAAIEELEEKLTEAKDRYKTAVEDLQSKLDSARETTTAEINTLNINHKRDMEQAGYDNKIALRDENLKAAEAIAGKHNKVVVDSTEFTALKEQKAAEEEAINAQIDTAVSSAKATVYASEGAKLSALKASTDGEIALLKKDKEYLTAEVASLNARLADALDQIKALPGQIKDAVAAGKADISVNQDAAGKR